MCDSYYEEEFFRVPFRHKLTQPQHQRIQCNIREWNWIVLNSYLEVSIQSLHWLDTLVSIVQNIHNIFHGKCPSMGGRGRWTKTFLSNREAAFQISRSPKPFTSQSTALCSAWHLDNFLEHLTAKFSKKHRCDATLKEIHKRNTAKKYSAVPDRIVWVLCDTRGREGLVSFYIWNALHSTGTAVDQRFSRDMLCQC